MMSIRLKQRSSESFGPSIKSGMVICGLSPAATTCSYQTHDSRHHTKESDAVVSCLGSVRMDCSRDLYEESSGKRISVSQPQIWEIGMIIATPFATPASVNRAISIALILLVFTTFAIAKTTSSRTDALGAHVNAGRGCPACHIPHSVALRERIALTRSASSAGEMLWGEDVTSMYAGCGGRFKQPVSANTPGSDGVLICLSCHDGNYGPKAMMRNSIYEAIPLGYGVPHIIPTLTDRDSLIAGQEIEDHPIGFEAQVKCGSVFGWDCTETNGVISMGGIHSSQFAANYGFFVRPSHYGNTSVVACTTCHNPHLMTITRVTASTASNLFPPGVYSTRHFLRAPYDPTDKSGNRSAQFCRQCHADKSNEMNGSSAISYQ